MDKHHTEDIETKELITKPVIAKRLSVGIRTIDQWVQRGFIKKIKIGNTTRFDWSDCLKRLKEQDAKASA